MISKKMEDALNAQVNREMYSAFLYMAMSTHSNAMGLGGFSNWFMVQYHEEMLHAMKLSEYIQRQGSKSVIGAIEKPPEEFGSALDMLKATLKHEQFITKSINDLVNLAVDEKDHATHIFLQWYNTKQIEEEENDNEIINKLELVGGEKADKNGLFMIDKELGSRLTNVPTDFSKGIEAA